MERPSAAKAEGPREGSYLTQEPCHLQPAPELTEPPAREFLFVASKLMLRQKTHQECLRCLGSFLVVTTVSSPFLLLWLPDALGMQKDAPGIIKSD